MKYYIETERLILRDLLPTDEETFFKMDSNQELHKYLGNKPSTGILQTREMIENIVLIVEK
jgi:ribosomal-protein-alanine N-acetyltransferase